MTGQIWTEVYTNKRCYYVRQGAQVAWLPGEQVISIDVIETHPEWSDETVTEEES